MLYLSIILDLDELFANTNIEEFVNDYNGSLTASEIKKKYNISSKSLELFVKSLISMGKINKQKVEKKNQKNYNNKNDNLSKISNLPLSNKVERKYNLNQDKILIKIDNEINDVLLGINEFDDHIDIEQNESQKCKFVNDDYNLEKNKEEFIFLWNENVPNRYLIHKFGIPNYILKNWKEKLNLPTKKVHSNPKTYLKYLKNKLILIEIEIHLSLNNGVMFLNDLSLLYNLSQQKIFQLIKNSKNIGAVRLAFPAYKRETSESVKYFQNYAFEILIYMNIQSLLEKLIQLLEINNEEKITSNKKIIMDLCIPQLEKKHIEEVVNFLNNESSILRHFNFDSSSLYKERAIIKRSIGIWEEINIIYDKTPKIISSKIISKLSDEEQMSIRDAIINILESEGRKGSTAIHIKHEVQLMLTVDSRHIQKALKQLLLQKKICISYYDGKLPIYVINRYFSLNSNVNLIYGRKIEIDSYLDEIIKLEKGKYDDSSNNQINRLAGLFVIRDFTIKKLLENERYFDFMAISKYQRIYVKISLFDYISKPYLLHFNEMLPPNSHGIIITFQDIYDDPKDILSILNKESNGFKIEIWTKEKVLELIKEKPLEPSLIGSIVQLMSGEYERCYGKVISNDFENLSQVIDLLGSENKIKSFFGNLYQIPDGHLINTNIQSYTELLKIIKTMCFASEFIPGIKIGENFIESNSPRLSNNFIDNLNEENLTKIILYDINNNSNNIKYNFHPEWNGFLFNDSDYYNDTPLNFCSRNVIFCDCIRSLEQKEDEFLLCRHLIGFFLYKWSLSLFKEVFMDLIINLKFFTKDIFVIYRFLLDLVNNNSEDVCKTVLDIFSLKQTKNMKFDFLEIIKYLKNLNSENLSLNDVLSSVLNYFRNNPNSGFENCMFVSSKFLQFNEIFGQMNYKQMDSCIKTLREMIDIFFIKKTLDFQEFEHFVIESLRDEKIDDEKLIQIISNVWMNIPRESLSKSIQYIRKIIKGTRGL